MAKKILCSVISFILCAVIAFVSCYFAIPDFNAWVKGKLTGTDFGGNTDDNNDNDGENKPIESDSANLLFGVDESNGISLMSAKIETLSAVDYVSYTITATITPFDAENKAVDWSLDAGENFDGDLDECLSVSPTFDGSLVAVVTCKKAFTGVAKLVVSTRDGGFTAVCSVTFAGQPKWLEIDASSLVSEYDSGWDVDIYVLKTSTSFALPVSLSNVYGSVDSTIIPNFQYKIIPHGSFYLENCTDGASGFESYKIVLADYATVRITGTVANNGTWSALIADNLYSMSLVDGSLNITTMARSVGGFSVRTALNSHRTDYEYIRFSRYVEEAKKPYMEICVTDSTTGFSTSINVRIDSNVTGVNLDNTNIVF